MSNEVVVPANLTHNERSKKLVSLLSTVGAKQITQSLPRALGLNPTRFMQQLFTAIQSTPAITECQPVSVVLACVKAAQAGIPIDGVHGALVPFRDGDVKLCQFIPMYQGLMLACMRSGLIKSFRPPRAVFQGDEFHYEYGLAEMLRHVPAEDPENQTWEQLSHVYAIAQLKDSDEKAFVVMPRPAIIAIKARSKARNGPWATDPVPMGLKTAVRNLCKYLPKSADDMAYVQMLKEDEEFDAGIAAQTRDDALTKMISEHEESSAKTTVAVSTEAPKVSMDELAGKVIEKRRGRKPKEQVDTDTGEIQEPPPPNNDTFSAEDDRTTARPGDEPQDEPEDSVLVTTPVPPLRTERPSAAPPRAAAAPASRSATSTAAPVSPAALDYSLAEKSFKTWRTERVGGNGPLQGRTWDGILSCPGREDWQYKSLVGIVRDAISRRDKGGTVSEMSMRAAYILAQLEQLFA